MDVTIPNVAALTQNVITRYNKSYEEEFAWWEEVAERVDSSRRSVVYVGGETTVKMREWTGGRVAQGGVQLTYELANKPYEATLAFDANYFKDDEFDFYYKKTDELGVAAKRWPNYLVRDAFLAGKTLTCIDGKPFFSATHYISPSKKTGSQSNLLANKILNKDNLEAAILAGRILKDGTGELFNNFTRQLTLIVDPTNEDVALQLTDGDMVVRSQAQSGSGAGFGSVNNTRKGRIRTLMIPDLYSEPGVWYLADLSAKAKPFVMQFREEPNKLVSRVDPNLDNVFRHNQFEFGINGRGMAGFGDWQRIIRVEPS